MIYNYHISLDPITKGQHGSTHKHITDKITQNIHIHKFQLCWYVGSHIFHITRLKSSPPWFASTAIPSHMHWWRQLAPHHRWMCSTNVAHVPTSRCEGWEGSRISPIHGEQNGGFLSHGGTPQIIQFNRIFHDKQFALGISHDLGNLYVWLSKKRWQHNSEVRAPNPFPCFSLYV